MKRSVKAAEAAVLWTGWTLLKSDGKLAVDSDFEEPFLWIKKFHAKECVEEGDKVVRCEIRLAALRKKKGKR